jgi:hypothetical protein
MAGEGGPSDQGDEFSWPCEQVPAAERKRENVSIQKPVHLNVPLHTCPPRLHTSNLKMKFKDNIFKALYKLASFAYAEVVELI